MTHPILVTGAPGRVGGIGRKVTELLLKQGNAVRAMLRSEDERANSLRDLGAEVVIGDFGAKVAALLAGWAGSYPRFQPALADGERSLLTFFGSFVFGTPGFPLSDVPLREIAADAAAGRLDIKPVRVFKFDEIQEAHRVMESNQAAGKMVVVHN